MLMYVWPLESPYHGLEHDIQAGHHVTLCDTAFRGYIGKILSNNKINTWN